MGYNVSGSRHPHRLCADEGLPERRFRLSQLEITDACFCVRDSARKGGMERHQ
jgi:hypothetical protein